MKDNEYFKSLHEKFPFLSIVKVSGEYYIGIIQNECDGIISMYIYDRIGSKELREQFIQIGNEWWWTCDRNLPINFAYPKQFENFNHALISFTVTKDFEMLFGNSVSLDNIQEKRAKRRTLKLVKKNL